MYSIDSLISNLSWNNSKKIQEDAINSRELNWKHVAATGVLLAVIGSVIAAPLTGGASLGVLAFLL